MNISLSKIINLIRIRIIILLYCALVYANLEFIYL